LKDAGYDIAPEGVDEWGLKLPNSPDRWTISKEKARNVILRVSHRLCKPPEKLRASDLIGLHLIVMVKHFHPEGRNDFNEFMDALGFTAFPGVRRVIGAWAEREYRTRAVQHLVSLFVGRGGRARGRDRKMSDIRQADFRSAGLDGLYYMYVNPNAKKILGYDRYIASRRSPVARALLDARVIQKGSPEENALEARSRRERYTFEAPEMVRRAIRAAVKASGLHPAAVKHNTLAENGAKTPLDKLFNGNYFKALQFAGFKVDIEDHIGRKPPGYWASKENRVRAVRRLVEERGGPGKITARVMRQAGLMSLYVYHPRLVNLLKEAGYVISYKNRMKCAPRDFWNDPTVRHEAVRSVVEARGGPDRVLSRDVVKAGLGTLLSRWRLRELLLDAGYRIEPWCMAGLVPRGFWLDKRNRRRALRWLISRTRKAPGELTMTDMVRYGLGGLYNSYYQHRSWLDEPHPGRLSCEAPRLKRILVREGVLKGDWLYGGALPKGEKRPKAKGYERHWVPRKEPLVRMKAGRKAAPKVAVARKGRTVWKVTREKGKARIRNF
jgi:hypothetical protein